ncbi:MAG: 5-formyltetrahydrofolate cyclo-ligase [Lachnospiraceae bacterium]|nr:5-formyltetrahydrofolate cyclo-ligase [Lachnospiraceae bacterium]
MTEKEVMRKEIREKLARMSGERLKEESLRIASRILSMKEYLEAECMAGYASMKREAQSDEILEDALKRKKSLFLPRVTGDSAMEFMRVTSMSGLIPQGAFGIREPLDGEALNRIPDLALIPGLAFDRKGNRLGRGRGYYDRILREWKGKCLLAGLCLSAQIMPSVPCEEWDIPVDFVVFPEGISCALGDIIY